MDEHGELAGRFEANRAHLGAVAYRMLGWRSEADDAVQEAWLRLSRSDASAVENLGGSLTQASSGFLSAMQGMLVLDWGARHRRSSLRTSDER